MLQRFTVLIVIVIALCCPAYAYADDGYAGAVAETPVPRNSHDIAMQAEVVSIILHPGYAEVECAYRFKNEGKAQAVQMGFPDIYDRKGNPGITQFRAYVDDIEFPVRTVTLKLGPGQLNYNDFSTTSRWFIQDVPFKEGQVRIIVNRYLAPYGGTASLEESFMTWFGYTMHTGATWKGKIGRADVNVTFASGLTWDDFTPGRKACKSVNYTVPKSTIEPSGYTKQEDGFSWTFFNLEPKINKDDISFNFFRDTTNGGLKGLKVAATSELHIGSRFYPASQAFDGNVTTAWVEGARGTGIGQTLTAEFKQPTQIGEIRILPGYVKTRALYKQNSRPKQITATFSNGTIKQIDLIDQPRVQYIKLSKPIEASWVKFTINSVYRGTTDADSCISEIEFGLGHTNTGQTAPKLLAGIATANTREATTLRPTAVRAQDATPLQPATVCAQDVLLAVAVLIMLLFAVGTWQNFYGNKDDDQKPSDENEDTNEKSTANSE
ncbi:MAG TPA: discoidin domain-containing protein [Candidatus Aquicultor sp.]|jgi:hypothetical protein